MTTYSLDDVRGDLIRDEGYRSKPYRDTKGFLTIGIGHNLDASGLCEAAIMAQFEYDLARVEAELDVHIPWWRTTPPDIQRVLINLCFNLGGVGLSKFRPTLALIRAGEYKAAARRLLRTLYAKQVGQRAERLASILVASEASPS